MRSVSARGPITARFRPNGPPGRIVVARAHGVDPYDTGIGRGFSGGTLATGCDRGVHAGRHCLRSGHRLGAHRLPACGAAVDTSPAAPAGSGRDGLSVRTACRRGLALAHPGRAHSRPTMDCGLDDVHRARSRAADGHHRALPSVRLFHGAAGLPGGPSFGRSGVPNGSRVSARARHLGRRRRMPALWTRISPRSGTRRNR